MASPVPSDQVIDLTEVQSVASISENGEPFGPAKTTEDDDEIEWLGDGCEDDEIEWLDDDNSVSSDELTLPPAQRINRIKLEYNSSFDRQSRPHFNESDLAPAEDVDMFGYTELHRLISRDRMEEATEVLRHNPNAATVWSRGSHCLPIHLAARLRSVSSQLFRNVLEATPSHLLSTRDYWNQSVLSLTDFGRSREDLDLVLRKGGVSLIIKEPNLYPRLAQLHNSQLLGHYVKQMTPATAPSSSLERNLSKSHQIGELMLNKTPTGCSCGKALNSRCLPLYSENGLAVFPSFEDGTSNEYGRERMTIVFQPPIAESPNVWRALGKTEVRLRPLKSWMKLASVNDQSRLLFELHQLMGSSCEKVIVVKKFM